MLTIKYQGYTAEITQDPDTGLYKGDILGLRGAEDFYGETWAELNEAFKDSIEAYLAICIEKGIPPHEGNSLPS